MRDFSKISPTIWTSRKFNSLPDDASRYAYLYLLCNSHCNSVGCYVLPDLYGCSDLKWQLKAYREALHSLCVAHLIDRDEPENSILITNWEAFNMPTNQKHAIGAIACLAQVPSGRLKLLAFQSLVEVIKQKGFENDKGVARAISMFLEAYGKPIESVLPLEGRRERGEGREETETRLDLEKTETRENAQGGLAAASPDGSSAHPPSDEIPDLPDALNRRLNPVASLLDTPLMRRTAGR